MTSPATASPPEKLGIALNLNANPLCIDIDPLNQPSACLRSSNGDALIPLKESEALEILNYIFRGTTLDPNAPVPGTALRQIGETVFLINCCPQHSGVIVTLHSKPGTLEDVLQAREEADTLLTGIGMSAGAKKSNHSWIRRVLSRIMRSR